MTWGEEGGRVEEKEYGESDEEKDVKCVHYEPWEQQPAGPPPQGEHQEDVGQDGELEGGVHQGVQGRPGARRDPVHVIQDKVTNIIDLDKVGQEQTFIQRA